MKERDAKHQLMAAVPGSAAIRAAGSLGEGDVVWCLAHQPAILIEVKATSQVNFRTSNTPETKQQWDAYKALAAGGHEVRYMVWYKRKDWRVYDVADYLEAEPYPVLKRDQGISFSFFVESTTRPEGTEQHDDGL